MMKKKTIYEDVAKLISFIKEPNYAGIMLCGENIKSIAKKCRELPLYQSSPEKKKEYLKSFKGDNKKKIVDVYVDFVCKVVKAPTQIHAKGCAILLIPILDDLITEEKEESSHSSTH